MKERLVEYLAYLGIGQLKFETKAGLSRGFVNKVGDNITLKSLNKIEKAYPDLNIEWLKTGKEPMLLSQTEIDKVEEGTQLYKRTCPECKKKDTEIARLNKELIECKNECIDLLRELANKKVS